MVRNEALDTVLDHLLNRNLGEAIVAMDNFLAVHPHQINTDRLFAIKTDYQLMADYWRRGFKDPQLPQLYDNLLRRMYVLYANMASNHLCRMWPCSIWSQHTLRLPSVANSMHSIMTRWWSCLTIS